MARRRLTPAMTPAERAPETKSLLQPGDPRSTDPVPAPGPASASAPPRRPPIAQVAGGAASEAALAELGAEMEAARREGRLVRDLPLGAVDEAHLERDRLPEAATGEAMEALVASLRASGQRTPIEVVDLGGGRHGLISGWRRLTALRRLAAEGEGPGTVRALVRAPGAAAEAYRAMVEENEIRADLSYWERARIVARAARAGAYADEEAALAGLFGAASRARRSKIRSFLDLVGALEGALPFPAALPERTGLPLARALRAPGRADALRARLAARPPADPEAQAALLEDFLRAPSAAPGPEGAAPPAPAPAPAAPPPDRRAGGVALRIGRGRIVLEGAALADPGFADELVAWLETRGR